MTFLARFSLGQRAPFLVFQMITLLAFQEGESWAFACISLAAPLEQKLCIQSPTYTYAPGVARGGAELASTLITACVLLQGEAQPLQNPPLSHLPNVLEFSWAFDC